MLMMLMIRLMTMMMMMTIIIIIIISRIPDQNGVSQAWYIVEIHHSGREASNYHHYHYHWQVYYWYYFYHHYHHHHYYKSHSSCSPANYKLSGYCFVIHKSLSNKCFTPTQDRLTGLVVKASTSGAEDPGFKSCLRRDFSGLSQTSGLKIDTPVATLPGTWHYRVNTGTGQPGVSILWMGEVESWICHFYLIVAARKTVWADPSLRYSSMLLGR